MGARRARTRLASIAVSLLTSLLLLIVLARLLGGLASRLGQPEVIGEILAGVVLGPAVLDVIQPSAALSGIAELAVFLVILSVGLEMRFESVVGAMKGRGLSLAALGFMLPFAGGVLLAVAYDLDAKRTVFMGLCISITALPVAAKILENLRIVDTPIGRYAISTAILNDVAALLVLGVILSVPRETALVAVLRSGALAGLKLLALAGVVLTLNAAMSYLDRRGIAIQALPERLVRYFGANALFGIVVLFALVFGSVSEALGFHFVVGAFFGALLLDKRHFLASRYTELDNTLRSVTGGFLAPVFFAYIGLEFDIDAFDEPIFAGAVLIISIVTKLAAGIWGGRLLGMTRREALALGCMLNGRGVMELVVASIAFERGFIGPTMFSTLVLMGIVTTLLTPFLFARVMPEALLVAYRRGERV